MALAPQNDFLVWAGGTNANVLTQAQYADLGNLTSGVVSGKASAQHANKVWRQTSIMSSMIAKFIVDRLAVPVVDDGTIATIETNFIAAIKSVFVIPPTGVVPGTYGPTMSLSVQLDGRVTGVSNTGLTPTGITPGTYVGTTVTVGADGRITGIVGVPYGPLANANSWTATNTFTRGVVANVDAGFLNFRALNTSFGAGMLNDNTNAYLMSTYGGGPLGIYSGYRPFYWNMASGAVTIDGTGSGATFGGNVTAAGRLRALLGAFGSGDLFAATLLTDFSLVTGASAAWQRLPNGFILQSGIATVTGGSISFPTPFPNACLNAFANEGAPGGWAGSGQLFPTVFGTDHLTRFSFDVTIAQWEGTGSPSFQFPSGPITTRWIAIGY